MPTTAHRLTTAALLACALWLTATPRLNGQAAVPGAPSNFRVDVNGNTVTVTWGPPASGGTPTNYVLAARTTTGAPIVQTNVWPTPSFIGAVPNGVYVVTVWATNAAGAGPEATPVTITVPSTPTGPNAPGAPINFQASVAGNTLTASWNAPTTGGAPSAYALLARQSTGGPVVASLNVGGTTSFQGAVPNGTYIVSAQASNSSGAGPESNVATITVPSVPGGAGRPQAPTDFVATASGQVVNLTWGPPDSGPIATGYTIVARTTAGAVIVNQPVGNTFGFVSTVPAGTYVLSVLASNASGNGPETSSRTLTLPAATQPPGTPTNLTGSVTGSAVVFSWNAPTTGGAVESYALQASTTSGGAPIATLTVPGSVRQTSVPGVPPGTYFARVTATNAAGASAPSQEASVGVSTNGVLKSTLNPPGVPASIEARTSQAVTNGQLPSSTFDDFVFPAGATFSQVSWQGIYCRAVNNSGLPSPTASAFNIRIHADGGGQPVTAAAVYTANLSLAQVNQTFAGAFTNATCSGATNTTWALYSYSVNLPTPFTAQPGVRYWLTVQAVTPSYATYYGWRRGSNDNFLSYQFFNGGLTRFSNDRAFALAP